MYNVSEKVENMTTSKQLEKRVIDSIECKHLLKTLESEKLENMKNGVPFKVEKNYFLKVYAYTFKRGENVHMIKIKKA